MARVDTNADCGIDLGEMQAFVDGLAAPDIDLDGDGVADALSVGVGAFGVIAQFSEP